MEVGRFELVSNSAELREDLASKSGSSSRNSQRARGGPAVLQGDFLEPCYFGISPGINMVEVGER